MRSKNIQIKNDICNPSKNFPIELFNDSKQLNPKKYENVEYPGYDSSMKNGDDVTVLYQSSNPDNIAEGNITGNAVIMIVAGAAFAVMDWLWG